MRIEIGADPKLTSQVVSSGLGKFNRDFLGEYDHIPISVDLCNSSGQIIGGAIGTIVLGWLCIDILWVPEEFRGSKFGSQILEAMECEAKRLGASRAMLDTLGFQAEKFYEKHGFEECGRIVNFASGFDRIYMTKSLV